MVAFQKSSVKTENNHLLNIFPIDYEWKGKFHINCNGLGVLGLLQVLQGMRLLCLLLSQSQAVILQRINLRYCLRNPI